jgi:anhydro-N-acetylmuramic acid kinase
MSGTSLDGMDAALVRFTGPTDVELLAFASCVYDSGTRRSLEEAITSHTAADLARLHAQLGHLALAACQQVLDSGRHNPTQLDFISFPGHTVWHEPPTVSWQLGDPAILAETFGTRVVHDFRARDIAAGGEGAPLVPMADVLLFGHKKHSRVLLNIGGMANLTYVRRAANEDGVVAFDAGPGMALIDALAREVDSDLSFDQDAVVSSQGKPDQRVVDDFLAHEFFSRSPPKSTGRERFGAAAARDIADRVPGPDGVATAVAITVESIARAIERWVPAPLPEVVVSGGGRRHPGILRGIEARLASGGTEVRLFDDLFFDGDAKEAVAFALLGYLTVHGQPGNLPAATGARSARVLGSITPP